MSSICTIIMYAPLGENAVFACLGVVESCDIVILLLIMFGSV